MFVYISVWNTISKKTWKRKLVESSFSLQNVCIYITKTDIILDWLAWDFADAWGTLEWS